MLLKFLGCMILAGILEYLMFIIAAKFFEWRFLTKSQSVVMLYDSIYSMIEAGFNNDNQLRVSVNLEYCKSKIKFRNAVEANLKIQIMLQKCLKNYYILEYLADQLNDDLEGTEVMECKKIIEEICEEIRTMKNNHAEQE